MKKYGFRCVFSPLSLKNGDLEWSCHWSVILFPVLASLIVDFKAWMNDTTPD